MSQKAVELPLSLAVLQSAVVHLNQHQSFLDRNSDDFKRFYAYFQTEESSLDKTDFVDDELAVTWLQTLYLVALSLFGGIFIPGISQFSVEKDKVMVHWHSGVSDRFQMGVFDDDFTNFHRTVQSKIFNKPNQREIYPTILLPMLDLFRDYLKLMETADQRLKKMMAIKTNFQDIFTLELNKDLLFILMSSLPAETLNQLFIYVQQFLPDDLEVKTRAGNVINIQHMFQKQTNDIQFLIENVHVYLDLYFATNRPIIQEITQSKTIEYAKRLMQNPKIKETVNATLRQLSQGQIKPRIQLYTVVFKHLQQLSS